MQNYYLVGSPISHSLSPFMMNLSFRIKGFDAVYGLREADEAALPGAVESLLKEGASGWNVTMPDKHAMSLLCDELSPESLIGESVNTVKNENGRLIGYTTDGAGFMNAAAASGCDLTGEKMTLLGSGGASAAILIRASLAGVREISVFCNRKSSFRKIEEIREKLAGVSKTRIGIFAYDPPEILKKEIADSRALINATNVGMETGTGRPLGCLIPDSSYFHPNLFVYDIIYHPFETPLVLLARGAGLHSEGGLSMLIRQGAESFRIWTGTDMPVEDVSAAVRKQLQ